MESLQDKLYRITSHVEDDGKTVWEYSLPNKEDYKGNSYSTPVIYIDKIIIYRSEDVAGLKNN